MRFKDFINEETTRKYFNRLVRTLNIKELGAGMYATVFQHPVYHNVAVKFFQDDPRYLKYLEFCQKNQNNLWLPKIVSVHKVDLDADDSRDFKKDTSIVFFQKLRDAKEDEIEQAYQEIVSSLPPELKISGLRFYGGFEDMKVTHWKDIAEHSKDPDVRQLAKILVKIGALDIHSGNVMMRDEGDKTQLVFTDPVS